MARKVDPKRHEARRLHIIDAAITIIAACGYERATTAAICREAGIGSGTFFHYFPTKADLLLAILAQGTSEVDDLQARLADEDDPLTALDLVVEKAVSDAHDPRTAGFVRAVATAMSEPAIASALHADEKAQRELLRKCIVRAQDAGQIRIDLSAERLVSWLRLLLDGFLDQIAADSSGFTAAQEGPVLRATVRTFLIGPAPKQV